jgi:hypothetical protein
VIDCVANEHHQVTCLPFLADAHDPDGFPNPTIFFFFSFLYPYFVSQRTSRSICRMLSYGGVEDPRAGSLTNPLESGVRDMSASVS